jgi:hypothetical protein
MLLPGTFGSLSANTGFTSAPASSPTDWGSQLGVGYKKGGNSQGSPELRNWIGHEILLCFLLHAVFWAGLTACTDRKLIAIWFQVFIVATRWVSFLDFSEALQQIRRRRLGPLWGRKGHSKVRG